MLKLSIAILFVLLFTTPAQALLNVGNILASSIVPHGRQSCAIPLHLPSAKYAKKDAEHETELCSYAYNENVAACPKRRSTNPAIELFTPPAGMSVKDLLRRECVVKDAKKVAKYKLSFTCSYSPGILAYYHVSRAIGNVANVPPAVLRTWDRRDHQDMARHALSVLRNRTDSVIYQSWYDLERALDDGQRSEAAARIFTDDYNETFGALLRNPRGEHEYAEFNGVYGNPDRLGDFKRGPIYSALTSQGLRAGRELNAANTLAMRQLKDAADFIVLDTLLSQQDRFGNFHYKEKMYFLGENGLEKADELKDVPDAFKAKAVKVKEMLLRDNDCGVGMSFTGRAKQAKLLEGVAHMDPETYHYLLSFAAGIDTAETKDFFLRGLQLRESDFKRLQQNTREVAALVLERCRAGRLSLDLDLKAHFGAGEIPAQSCE